VPLSAAQHPDLQEALRLLGVPLPGPKALAGPVLDQTYRQLQVRVDAVLRTQKVRGRVGQAGAPWPPRRRWVLGAVGQCRM
jgi:hypothetical protein